MTVTTVTVINIHYLFLYGKIFLSAYIKQLESAIYAHGH